jgi:hypothetical protein
MKVNRRKTLGILAAAVTGAHTTVAQAPPPRAAAEPDAALQSAREGYRSDAQRIAALKLPQTTEPAFRFQA